MSGRIEGDVQRFNLRAPSSKILHRTISDIHKTDLPARMFRFLENVPGNTIPYGKNTSCPRAEIVPPTHKKVTAITWSTMPYLSSFV